MLMRNHRIIKTFIAFVGAFAISCSAVGCEFIIAEDGSIYGISEASEASEVSSSAESLPAGVDLEGPYEVDRVVDGDTLIVYIDGVRTRVRLIGINTPESVAPEEERNTEEGVIASDYVKTLMEDSDYEVWLEYDNERYDQYDRTLAYVYIDYDGEVVMLERILLEEGYAETVRYGTNDRYYEEFCELEAEAS